MKSRIKLLGLCVIYPSLYACGSSTHDTPTTISDNDNGNYKSVYCVKDDVAQLSDDTFISIDAFYIAPDIPASIGNSDVPAALPHTLLYAGTTMSAASANLQVALGPMLALASCAIGSENRQLDAENIQCDFTALDGTGARLSGSAFPYWQGSYSTSGEIVTTWSREQGTETFSSSSGNGDFLEVTEKSDCSGTISSQTTNNDGSVATRNGSWKISGTTTVGKVTVCKDGDDCYSLSW